MVLSIYMKFLDLLNDIEKTLNKGFYYTATIACLTLPDICGALEYKGIENIGKRYTCWYRKYTEPFERESHMNQEEMPWLSAELVYAIRCRLLHEGLPEPDPTKISQKENKVTRLKIRFYDSSRLSSSSLDSSKNIIEYEINAVYLCKVLLNSAKRYYKSNKEKFDKYYEDYNRCFELMIDYIE